MKIRIAKGDTLRANDYRFTEYTDREQGPIARMLYDHRSDPEENVNVAEADEQKAVAEDLTMRLRQGKGKDDDLK